MPTRTTGAVCYRRGAAAISEATVTVTAVYIVLWALVALAHWVAGRFNGWHLTERWGTFATVSVAVIAIIVSIVSLRRNAAQFEQQRLVCRTVNSYVNSV
jgi:uncharacterized membrane protein (DUF485 family)